MRMSLGELGSGPRVPAPEGEPCVSLIVTVLPQAVSGALEKDRTAPRADCGLVFPLLHSAISCE